MGSLGQIISNDLFTRLCKALFSAEYKDFQTIDDSGGDAGNDGYSESQQILFQMYCPEKPEKADDATYKAKIKEDLDKAKKLSDSGTYKIKEWVFVTSRELREPVQTYLRTEASSRGLAGIAWSSPKLTELFSKHNHLRSQFPDLIQPDIEQQIEKSTAQVMDRMDSVADVKQEFRTKLEKRYQQRIDKAKESLDGGKNETARKEYESILSELNSETEKIDPHIYFRAYNNLGVSEQNLGNQAKAAELFEKAYLAEPELPMAIAKHALSKMLSGAPAEGLPIIEKLLETHPNDDHALSVKANILWALERYSELIPFLRSKGKIAQAHWFEGFEKMAHKDYDGAISSFENVVRLEPDNTRALQLVAQNVMVGTQQFVRNNPFPPDKIPPEIKNKFERAIVCLKDAIRLLKDGEQKEDLEMAFANLSGCYVAIGLYQESVNAAEEAVKIDPNSAVPFLNKGIAQLKLGKFQDAIKSLQSYKDLGGEDVDVDRHIAYCSLRSGDLSTAEKIIEQSLKNNTGLDIDIAELAVDLYSRKLDNEKLNPLLERLEKEFPINPQALRVRSLYLQRRGMEGAEELMRKSLENSVSESDKMLAETDIADLKFDTKDYASAEEIYKKYINLQETNQPTLRYAECLYNSGQYGVLLGWIETLGPEVRKESFIRQVEAYANLYLGNLDKASKIFKDLFEKSPGNLKHLVFYGMCRFRLGKEKETKEAYDAIKNRVSETQDLLILAGGYEFIGEWDIAIELTFKALESDPNNPKAHLAFDFTFLRREQADGKEPDEKYIKAFQKSMAEFSKRFPEEKALQSFEIKDNDVSGIFKMVDQMAEMTDNATNLYKESQAPLAVIPRLTGKKPFDVWAAFTQMPEVGIKISFGSADEIGAETVAIDAQRDGSIVADIYPLFLLAHFDHLELLPKLFKKTYVHQSVLDELMETVEDKKISVRRGLTVLGKVNGQHRMTEIPSDQVQKTLDLLEKIRSFVTTSKSVEVRGFSKDKSKEEENIINALEESTRDSALLAQELNVPLYCDDRILRVVLQRDHKSSSFSSQTLFIVAHRDKLISLDEKYTFQKGMIDLNYDFISMDAIFIYTQLKNSGYQIEGLQKIVSTLVKKETNIQSLGMVLADLLFMLMMDTAMPGPTKLKILKYIAEQAAPNHDLAKMEEGVFMNLQKRVRPDKHDQLRKMVRVIF